MAGLFQEIRVGICIPRSEGWASERFQGGEHLLAFRDLLCEEMGQLVNASWCHGQDICSGKWKPRSSCDRTFSKHLSCSFPSCMGKIIFSLLYKVGFQDFHQMEI